MSPLASNFDGTQTLRLPLPMTTTLIAAKLNVTSPRVVASSSSASTNNGAADCASTERESFDATAAKFEIIASNGDLTSYVKKLEQER